MNGFSYNEDEKKIQISDETHVVTWERVEKNIAEEAGKMFAESKNIDDFLLSKGCERSWVNK